MPRGLEARASEWRSRVAGRRLLIVLDNAAGPSQVRELLPGEPGCLTFVTSRTRLTGLDGAAFHTLDVMGRDEAVSLLRRVVAAGGSDTDRTRRAAGAIVDSCGRLPLAIRLAGGHLSRRPAWTIAELAERIADESARQAILTDTKFRLRSNSADKPTSRNGQTWCRWPCASTSSTTTTFSSSTVHARERELATVRGVRR